MDLPRALQLLSLPLPLGEHPELGGPVLLNLGRFGPYVEHADKAASLPKVSLSPAGSSLPPPVAVIVGIYARRYLLNVRPMSNEVC